MNPDVEEMDGGCHCGAVRFHAKLRDGLRDPRACNCSICRMHGAVVVTAMVGQLEVTRGEDVLSCYRFNTGTARHYFCSRCGIYTHHQRRSHPDEYSVNVACLDGVSPFDFLEVPVGDGVHHSKDDPEGRTRLAGALRFFPAG